MTTKAKTKTRDDLVADLSDARRREQDALADIGTARLNGGEAGSKLSKAVTDVKTEVSELEEAVVQFDQRAEHDAVDEREKQALAARIALIEWGLEYVDNMGKVHSARVGMEGAERAVTDTINRCPRHRLLTTGAERWINPENGYREDIGVRDSDVPEVIASLIDGKYPRHLPRDFKWSDERTASDRAALEDLLAAEKEKTT